MRRMTWRIWNIFGKNRRQSVRGSRSTRNANQTPEVLESRALLTGTASGEVLGTAFIDTDQDGTKDANELTTKGVLVHLVGQTTIGTAVDVSATTRADGTYKFLNVLPGDYTVTGDTGTVLGGTAVVTDGFTVVGGETETHDLAFLGLSSGSISLRQFLTNTVIGSFPFAAAGTTDGLANARENNLPELQDGNAEVDISNKTATTIDLAGLYTDPDTSNSQVLFKTSLGDFNVELFDDAAPQTVENFFNYVNDNRYDNTFFHRLIGGFVLQGGGFSFNDTITAVAKDPTVENEFDITRSNVLGTIAMAKVGLQVPSADTTDGPDSATNEFFFNLGNNANNLNNQNGGFTVFGRVVAAADQTVLNTLAATPIRNQSASNGVLGSVPLRDYSGPNNDPNFLTTVTNADNFLVINDIQIVRRDELLTHEIVADSNTNPDLVTATLVNNRLTFARTAGAAVDAVGTAQVTIRTTDRLGASIDKVFTVNVVNAPVADVNLSPNSPTTVSTVTANVTTSDLDNDPVSLTYRWTRTHVVGGSVVTEIVKTTSNTSSTSDTLNLTTLTGNAVQAGEIIGVEVIPNDGTIDGLVAFDTVTVV